MDRWQQGQGDIGHTTRAHCRRPCLTIEFTFHRDLQPHKKAYSNLSAGAKDEV